MFEFTEDDLKANKRGQLSQSQKEWLKMVGKGGVRLQSFNVWIAIGFMFLGLCLILALFLRNEDTRAALFANPLNFGIFPILIVVVVSILALSLLLARWNANKLQNAVLSSASGNVRFDQDSSGESGITTYYVVVGRKKFKFGDDMSGAFQEGEKYRFYYCKAGFYEFVMSYEYIDK
jgi:heme/copper-type cytochrome/quinol oxidase subunit 4